MTETQNYVGKVKVIFTDDNGKQKKLTEQHLVNAVSVTDAEVKLTKHYEGDTREWEVIAVTTSPIQDYIN